VKILFLIPYPLKEAPSQRFRFEQYFPTLKSAGIEFRTQSFFSSQQWRVFYRPGKALLKFVYLLIGLTKRTLILLELPGYDFVFIHREAAPLGPPLFEWIIAKLFQKKIIYDFDDAIWLTDKVDESQLEKIVRWRSKVASICQWAYKVSTGNEYLRKFAAQYNPRAIYNPTTIDTEYVHNPNIHTIHRSAEKIVIGWTGSHSTLKYLRELAPVFQILHQKFPNISILVIANQPPDFELPALDFRPWSEATEITDLLQADIGVMPLPDDQWANGKCGFKALQYMALTLPAVAAPVGVNKRIIIDGENGFLCSTESEWEERLAQLITDESLRKKMGLAGRRKVINEYSISSNRDNFLSLFK
jgi:glycosyltransferase involved in cell wall biosynthesis